MRQRWICVALLAALGACMGDDDDDSNKKSGNTVESQCKETIAAICSRAVTDCNLSSIYGELATCESGNTAACCADKCQETAISSQTDIDGCVNAAKGASCDGLGSNPVVLPTECQGVVKRPAALGPQPDLEPSGLGSQIASE